MSVLNAIDRDHVLTAIDTWDTAGGANYLLVRGQAPTHVLEYGGREYDAPAIAGIAHGLATGRTLTADDIPGGGAAVAKALTRLGFDVRDDSPPAPVVERAPRSRSSATTSRAPRARAAAPAKQAKPAPAPPALCPTCFLALPATGICDDCG